MYVAEPPEGGDSDDNDGDDAEKIFVPATAPDPSCPEMKYPVEVNPSLRPLKYIFMLMYDPSARPQSAIFKSSVANPPLLWNHCYGIIGGESLLWNHFCGIIGVESLLWNHCCGIVAVESLLWNHCCGIIVVESLLWNHCCGIWQWNPGNGILAVDSWLCKQKNEHRPNAKQTN